MNYTPYAIILALLMIVGAAFGGYHYGVKNQATRDIAASDALVIKAQTADAVKIAALTAQLEKADALYDQTLAQLNSYVTANPVGVVRLCNNPLSGSPVSSPPAHPGTTPGPSTAPGVVQPVPSGNSAAGPVGGADIGNLLSLLAERADQVSAQLSALQTAEQNR